MSFTRLSLRRIFGPLALILAAVVLLPLLLSALTLQGQAAVYNDQWTQSYENMKERDGHSVVPTLFKNDTAFGNHKRFPLVVANNTAYVPVEMFSGLSGVEIHNNKSFTSFYIINKTSKTSISFDLENDLVTTHELKSYTLKTAMYYTTRYLPAQEVASVLGITCEIYDDLEAGVYALRLSDSKAILSFDELIAAYSPKAPEEPVSPPVVVPPVEPPKTDDPPVTPTTPDTPKEPALDFGSRQLYLSFDVTDTRHLAAIRQTLGNAGLSAVFFFRPDDIAQYSERVRELVTDGFPIGFLLSADDTKNDLASALDNYYTVTKHKSYLIRIEGGSRACTLDNAAFHAFLEESGAVVWDSNLSLDDRRTMLTSLNDALASLQKSQGTTRAVIRFPTGPNTAACLDSLIAETRTMRGVTYAAPDPFSSPLSRRS